MVNLGKVTLRDLLAKAEVEGIDIDKPLIINDDRGEPQQDDILIEEKGDAVIIASGVVHLG